MSTVSTTEGLPYPEGLRLGGEFADIETYLAQEAATCLDLQHEKTLIDSRLAYMNEAKGLLESSSQLAKVEVSVLEDGSFRLGDESGEQAEEMPAVLENITISRRDVNGYFEVPSKFPGWARLLNKQHEGPTISSDSAHAKELETEFQAQIEKLKDNATFIKDELIHRFKMAAQGQGELTHEQNVAIVARVALIDAITARLTDTSGRSNVLDPHTIAKAPAVIEQLINNGIARLEIGHPVILESDANPFCAVVKPPEFVLDKTENICLHTELLTILRAEGAESTVLRTVARPRNFQRLADRVLSDPTTTVVTDIFPDKYGWQEVNNTLHDLSDNTILPALVALATLYPDFEFRIKSSDELKEKAEKAARAFFDDAFRSATYMFSEVTERLVPADNGELAAWSLQPTFRLGVSLSAFINVLSNFYINKPEVKSMLEEAGRRIGVQWLDNKELNRYEKVRNTYIIKQILDSIYAGDLPELPRISKP